jgi:hypothetical protein
MMEKAPLGMPASQGHIRVIDAGRRALPAAIVDGLGILARCRGRSLTRPRGSCRSHEPDLSHRASTEEFDEAIVRDRFVGVKCSSWRAPGRAHRRDPHSRQFSGVDWQS